MLPSMIQEFKIEGMSCKNCVDKITEAMRGHGLREVEVSLREPQLKFTSDVTVTPESVELWLAPLKSYHVAGMVVPRLSFFATYKPLILVFWYIVLGVALEEMGQSEVNSIRAMSIFMGGFFLFFSFFKFLNLKAFAEAYSTYDVIAKKWSAWGLIYPFLELALGILYCLQVSGWVNFATIALMAISLIGVVQALLQKRTIQCACLGTIFNLPMSKVTVFEDGLMILMAAVMIIK
jgi:copper chaperone CopZ